MLFETAGYLILWFVVRLGLEKSSFGAGPETWQFGVLGSAFSLTPVSMDLRPA